MLEVGMKYKIQEISTPERSAKAMGSGGLEVFSTPSMIALIEKTCYACVQEHLEEGKSTVGTLINVKHLSATPIFMNVSAECEVTEIDGRRIAFKVSAFDECGKIGEGIHERFIIDTQRFLDNANHKMDG